MDEQNRCNCGGNGQALARAAAVHDKMVSRMARNWSRMMPVMPLKSTALRRWRISWAAVWVCGGHRRRPHARDKRFVRQRGFSLRERDGFINHRPLDVGTAQLTGASEPFDRCVGNGWGRIRGFIHHERPGYSAALMTSFCLENHMPSHHEFGPVNQLPTMALAASVLHL